MTLFNIFVSNRIIDNDISELHMTAYNDSFNSSMNSLFS
jgi:hypothetical protein